MALFSEQVVGRATGCIGMGGTAENIRLDSVSVAHFKFLFADLFWSSYQSLRSRLKPCLRKAHLKNGPLLIKLVRVLVIFDRFSFIERISKIFLGKECTRVSH